MRLCVVLTMLVLVTIAPAAEAKKFRYAEGPKPPADTTYSMATVSIDPVVGGRGEARGVVGGNVHHPEPVARCHAPRARSPTQVCASNVARSRGSSNAMLETCHAPMTAITRNASERVSQGSGHEPHASRNGESPRPRPTRTLSSAPSTAPNSIAASSRRPALPTNARATSPIRAGATSGSVTTMGLDPPPPRPPWLPGAPPPPPGSPGCAAPAPKPPTPSRAAAVPPPARWPPAAAVGARPTARSAGGGA